MNDSRSDPNTIPPVAASWVRCAAAILMLGLLASCFTRTPAVVRPFAPAIDVSNVTVVAQESRLAAHWHRGAFMQIFVRSYQDSDGDGVGDLKGVTQRLDYLKDLGITGLWLMPVTPSADKEPGDATTDHRAIEPAYGRLADFDELIREAHQRGIGVILSYTLNHSSAEHPLFVAARQAPTHAFRDWFVWTDAAPVGWSILDKNPWYHAASRPWDWKARWEDLPTPPSGARGHYFATFGGHLPDFNFRNPKVIDFHINNLRFWLNRGVDGFRLDTVAHLVENDAQRWNDQLESRQLAALVAQEVKIYPNRYVVCDTHHQPQAYAEASVCGSAFATDQGTHAVKAALGDAPSINALTTYFRTAPASMATVMSNQDGGAGARLWDQVAGDVPAYKLAAATYLLQPGTPFIHYGEEVGQAGLAPDAKLSREQRLRAPMSWSARNVNAGGFTTGLPFRAVAPNVGSHNAEVERVDRESIHAFYKDVLTLRATRPSLSLGNFEAPFANRSVYGFQRVHGDERTLVLFNYGKTRVEYDVGDLPRRARMAPVFPRRAGASFVAEVTLADSRGRARVILAPRSVRVFDVEQRAP